MLYKSHVRVRITFASLLLLMYVNLSTWLFQDTHQDLRGVPTLVNLWTDLTWYQVYLI